ncbi:LysR substrate-binding domain-containing protein [Glaciimonas sp. PAMC28666]|uniref:LysR substrate-binding domain-containing protein n=1 Tax=Glaciimonas sp. PAMC28666 TaxID=2807626 RepID=UPI001966ABCA|nr:LysR substrate-binding domain-containing protein [Glaciimonas sp. PAMC28666]QRX83325.1 LysR family transcriptional regulator [Glaciimonas sp. PAMC28666]
MKSDPLSLRLFVSVLEEGTIASAAARHHIAAAAVSKRISELEVQLNTQLLIRSNKGISATAAGFSLLHLARGVLNDLDNIEIQMQAFASGTRGSVRVLANISVMTQFMPQALKSFLAKYPLVQVNLEDKVSTAIIQGVMDNIADIGIFTQVPHGEGLEVYPYKTDELVLIVPRDHPLAARSSVSFSDTLDFEFVGLNVGSSLNYQMVKSASELGRSLKLRIQVSGYDAQCLMVEAGLGIGILPKISSQIYGTLDIKKIALDEPWARRQIDICVRSYEALSEAAKRLFDHLQSQK